MKTSILLVLSLLMLTGLIYDSQTQNEAFIVRISVSSDGQEGNSSSIVSSISANGQFVAFSSFADNLVPNDNNNEYDVFVHDRLKRKFKYISISSDGGAGNEGSGIAQISGDGRYVAFWSDATNLVKSDTNGEGDIFVADLETSTTKRVSVASDGSEANHESRWPKISSDGRIIVFSSLASNLVENDNNNALDVFAHDQLTGETSLVSVTPSGTSGSYHSDNAVVSQSGRFIAFNSEANDLACCSSGFHNIFVRDISTGQTTHISKAYDGGETNDSSATLDISADGRYILFSSLANNLVENDSNYYCPVGGSPNSSCRDIFVYDQKTAIIKRVSVASDGTEGYDESYSARISPDSRYVAFWTAANNLSPHDDYSGPDLFVHDLTTSETKLVSIGYDGSQGNFWTYPGVPAFSADNTLLAFSSAAPNLVPNDTNGRMDVFVSRWQEVTRIYRLHLPLLRR